ncbi:zinc-dependent alcohol dehydrogenase family protein [Puia dinghuensis]|uniref:NADPH:quinone reductase n=1 Tax=Puia dinghuensis TaxID=1792502 RepID=A0A8J2U749_9BACT|nr:zinc-dependent alcohol dehydrogenase family protein [Puia dinghuensis]GGA83449.1 NADPH:quinone reductase [Puia dinghuensis]
MDNQETAARIVRFSKTGGPEVLQIELVEIQAPGPQEVSIRVKAIGLNRADTMYRMGVYMEQPVFPAKLGYEAAGVVEAVGTEVKGIQVGDKVSVLPAFSLLQYATYGELIVVPAYTIQKHPAVLSFEEAAAVWTSFLSVYGMLIEAAKLRAGEYVVITAASSSAGLAAIQLTNYAGGIPIAVTSSAGKREALLKAGAAHVILAGELSLTQEILKITAGKGADVALDPVGGPQFAPLVRAIREKGRIFVYGALNMTAAEFPTLDVLLKTPTISGYNAMDVLGNPPVLSAAIQYIIGGIAEGKLKPIVGRTFPFEQIVEATKYLESNQQMGKIVVTV